MRYIKHVLIAITFAVIIALPVMAAENVTSLMVPASFSQLAEHAKTGVVNIQTTKMAERLANGKQTDYWSEVKRFTSSTSQVASTVDGFNDPSDIARIFQDKFESLYTSVPYNNDDMNDLKSKISSRVT